MKLIETHKLDNKFISQYVIVVDINNCIHEIIIKKNSLDYGKLIDILINKKYSIDKMQAIINNYLLDSSNDLILKEFNEMQNYRKQCKIIAKEILQHYNL